MNATLAAPLTEADAITHGWTVFRAAQMADWPQEHAREIGRAVTGLYYELDMHGRLGDEWGRMTAPQARAAHAWAAADRAAQVAEVIRRRCGKEAAEALMAAQGGEGGAP